MLDAERTLLQAEQQYATSTTNVSLDLVQLFKALGGGWETDFPDVPSETAAVPVPGGAIDAALLSASGRRLTALYIRWPISAARASRYR